METWWKQPEVLDLGSSTPSHLTILLSPKNNFSGQAPTGLLEYYCSVSAPHTSAHYRTTEQDEEKNTFEHETLGVVENLQ